MSLKKPPADPFSSSADEELWEALGSSRLPSAPPRLLDDTLRRIRLDEDPRSAVRGWSWWARPWLSGVGVAGGVLAAVGGVLALAWWWPGSSGIPEGLAIEASSGEQELLVLEESLAEELLASAARFPELFSDQEVMNLLAAAN